jgi:hypothetical protein
MDETVNHTTLDFLAQTIRETSGKAPAVILYGIGRGHNASALAASTLERVA